MNETSRDYEVVTNRLLHGRLLLRQPRTGHRAGTEAVLLAAASGVQAGEFFIDVGAGVGTVGLIASLHQPECRGLLFEADPVTAAIARDNVAANGLGERLEVAVGDLFQAASIQPVAGRANLVVSNPPFYLPGTLRPSPIRSKAMAHVLAGEQGGRAITHGDWIRGMAALLKPRGRLLLIHRPDALMQIIAAMGACVGGILLRSIHAKAGAPAIRILVAGTAGSKAPVAILAPLVLHRDDGAFTAEAEAMHAGELMAFWPEKNRPKRAGRSSEQAEIL